MAGQVREGKTKGEGTMKFEAPLVGGKLIRRYKRFLADVELASGDTITAHCTNSGSMKSCLQIGADVFLSHNPKPGRKTAYTWEMIKVNNEWIGINTSIPNKFALNYITKGAIPGLHGYDEVKREVTFGNSRIDILAAKGDEKCFIEVKNVTLNEGGVAMFPDAVTTRGQKHLDTLAEVKKSGMRAVMLYIIQRSDVVGFAPAAHIDPHYAQKLQNAMRKGVEVIPLRASVSPKGVFPDRILPFYKSWQSLV